MSFDFFSVDRREEDLVILVDEKRRTIDVDCVKFADKVLGGDVVRLVNGMYHVDKDETRKRKLCATKLQGKLLSKKKKESK